MLLLAWETQAMYGYLSHGYLHLSVSQWEVYKLLVCLWNGAFVSTAVWETSFIVCIHAAKMNVVLVIKTLENYLL